MVRYPHVRGRFPIRDLISTKNNRKTLSPIWKRIKEFTWIKQLYIIRKRTR
jgi:hypothetical protein